VAVLAGAQYAQASAIWSPTSATASSTWSPDYAIGHTIDQSGLSAGFVSGVTNFDTYIGSNPIHTLVAAGNEWFSADGVTSATITYDLGSVLTIDRLALWNEEFSGFGTGRISTSLDDSLFSSLTSISPIDSPSNLDYGAQIFSLGIVSARYVRFDISGCPQPNGDATQICGIGEVAFSVGANQVPEPTSLALLGLGLAGAAVIRRRKLAR
jgi:hypothetical protein